MNIKKSLLIFLSILLSGVSMYSAHGEHSFKELSNRKRERSDHDQSGSDESNPDFKKQFKVNKYDIVDIVRQEPLFADEIITTDKNFSIDYPILASAFDLIGFDFQEFMQARLCGHYPYESLASGSLLDSAIAEAEDFMIESMVALLLEDFKVAIDQHRDFDLQNHRFLSFVMEYQELSVEIILQKLRESIRKQDLIRKAIISDNLMIIKKILVLGVSSSAVNFYMPCPDYIEVDSSSYNAQTPITPLHYAIFKNDMELINLLISNGASINVLDRSTASSPLYFAVVCQNKKAVEILLAAGADPNLTYQGLMRSNLFNDSALNYAVYHNREITLLLIEAGADVNRGTTLLIFAINTSDADLLTTLIQHGADVNSFLLNSQYKSPLDYAKGIGNQIIIDALIAAGARDVQD